MPVKAMKTPVRAKRSKAEMQQEFAEIQEQVVSAREAADAKAEGAAQLHAAEVRQGAEGITVEGVVQKISGLGLKYSTHSTRTRRSTHFLAWVIAERQRDIAE